MLVYTCDNYGLWQLLYNYSNYSVHGYLKTQIANKHCLNIGAHLEIILYICIYSVGFTQCNKPSPIEVYGIGFLP